MAGWLNSQKRRDVCDIRDFLQLHGKTLKSSTKPNTREVDRCQDASPLSAKQQHEQSTLNFEKVQPHNKKRSSGVAKENTVREKVPASTFSTGVRKKVTKHLHSCANEDKPPRKTHVVELRDSSVAQVTSKRSSRHFHHSKRSAMDSTSMKPRRQSLHKDRKKSPPNERNHKRKVLGDETNIIVPVNDTDGLEPFLSCRKKRRPNCEGLLESTSGDVPQCSQVQAEKEESARGKRSLVMDGHGEPRRSPGPVTVDVDDDNDDFIDTDELLAELSNCEKIVL